MIEVKVEIKHYADGRTYGDTIEAISFNFDRLSRAAELFEIMEAKLAQIKADDDYEIEAAIRQLQAQSATGQEIPEDVLYAMYEMVKADFERTRQWEDDGE